MKPLQHLRVVYLFRALINIVLFGIVLSSCKTSDVNKNEMETYKIINAIIETYTKKINNNVYLNPAIIEKDNYILRKNIFNDSGVIYNRICDKKTGAVKKEFMASMEEEKSFDTWDYSKIKNQRLTPKIILNQDEKRKYENSNMKDMLKNKHEIYTYKYTLWNNPDNIPLIRLSHPIISENKKYAIVYMSKYTDGTFVWVLEQTYKKDWNVICEKRLSHY